MAWKKWSLAGGLGLLAIWMAWSQSKATRPLFRSRTSVHRQVRPAFKTKLGRQAKPLRTSLHRAKLGVARKPSSMGLRPLPMRGVRLRMGAASGRPLPRPMILAKIPKDACDMIILVEGMT